MSDNNVLNIDTNIKSDMVDMLNNAYNKNVQDFARATFINMSKNILQKVAQVKISNEIIGNKEDLKNQEELLKTLYEEGYRKAIDEFTKTIRKPIALKENLKFQDEEEKESLISIYKEFILLTYNKELKLSFKEDAFKMVDKLNESYFYTISFEDDILKTKQASNSFLYTPLQYYKRILQKYQIDEKIDSTQPLEYMKHIEKILTTIEELTILNIFEEDIYKIF